MILGIYSVVTTVVRAVAVGPKVGIPTTIDHYRQVTGRGSMDGVNGFLRQNGGAVPGLTGGAISPRPVTDVTVPTLYVFL